MNAVFFLISPVCLQKTEETDAYATDALAGGIKTELAEHLAVIKSDGCGKIRIFSN